MAASTILTSTIEDIEGAPQVVSHTRSEDPTGTLYPHWQDGKYNPACSLCWHGFAHTQAVHDTKATA
jgi:hypothetical protein